MQIRLAIAAALFCVWSALLLYGGHQWGRADGADRASKLLAKQMDAVLAGQAEDRKRAEKLQKTLDRLPKAEKKQRDLVRANPAGCDRPAPVADGLQDAVDKANASRALPSDS